MLEFFLTQPKICGGIKEIKQSSNSFCKHFLRCAIVVISVHYSFGQNVYTFLTGQVRNAETSQYTYHPLSQPCLYNVHRLWFLHSLFKNK